MRKLFKKLSVLSVAAVLAAGTLSLAACGPTVKVAPDTSATKESVTSNGGFVVTTGDYYYFINGVEAYTSDNTYGKVVKGALMREKKSDLAKGENKAEIVVPSLLSSSDYSAGVYIYGEGANARVYYATPNNVENTSGKVESDYLDFKSAKLDGSDVKQYFHATENSTVYRFVEVDGVVYVLYVENNNLHSYNTSTGTDTLLVSSMSAYVLNSGDKTDPYVYYTMPVKGWIDTTGGGTDYKYNQIYRVRADATEAAHDFKLDQEWIDKENDGKSPYVNFGSIVLDGIGKTSGEFDTRFSPDYEKTGAEALPIVGYTYTLQAYNNDGIYFTRSQSNSDSNGLFYLSESKLGGEWNSILGNSVYKTGATDGHLEVVASKGNASKADSKAIFYIDEDSTNNVKHHYLYVKDSSIFRADVINDGEGRNIQYGATGATGDLEIAYDESGATLVSRDAESDSVYDYVYYTKSSGNGNSVQRVAYNGKLDNYSHLEFEGSESGNEAFRTVKLTGVEHASSWYNYEIIDNVVFFANSETVASTSYNYVYTFDLKNESGNLMTAAEIEERNDLYDLVMGEEGYLAKVTKDYSNLSAPIKYYFYTGKNEQFWQNIQDAEALGKKNNYLYKEDEQEIFRAFSEGKDVEFVEELNGDGVKYRVQSAFITFIGQKSEADETSETEYWKTALANYKPQEEDGGLAWWAWMLIGISIFVVVAGAAGAAVFVVLRRKKKEEKQPKKRMEVDTTDDKNVDVYSYGSEEAAQGEESGADGQADETVQETAQEPSEEREEAETPAEEPTQEEEEKPEE